MGETRVGLGGEAESPVAGSEAVRRPWLRCGLLLMSVALSFAGTLGVLRFALAVEEIGPFQTDLDGIDRAVHSQSRIGIARAKRDVHSILMLGDSMLMTLPNQPGYKLHHALPNRLERILKRRAPDGSPVPQIFSDPYPGESYTSFYFLADEFIESGPDQIVIEFNPLAMSAAWRGGWARTDYVAFVGWRRIPEALTLPLYKFGLTADRVLWTTACRELGYLGLWRRVAAVQGRVTKLRAALHLRAAALTGSQAEGRFKKQRDAEGWDRGFTPDLLRKKKSEYERSYREALAGVEEGDVSIRMMSAAVRRFVDAGIPTLVYVTPVNVEHMREVGALNGDGLQRSFDRLGEAVRAAGARYVDFHDLLSDEHFVDFSGHLSYEGMDAGNFILARKLAPLILEQAGLATRDAGTAN